MGPQTQFERGETGKNPAETVVGDDRPVCGSSGLQDTAAMRALLFVSSQILVRAIKFDAHYLERPVKLRIPRFARGAITTT